MCSLLFQNNSFNNHFTFLQDFFEFSRSFDQQWAVCLYLLSYTPSPIIHMLNIYSHWIQLLRRMFLLLFDLLLFCGKNINFLNSASTIKQVQKFKIKKALYKNSWWRMRSDIDWHVWWRLQKLISPLHTAAYRFIIVILFIARLLFPRTISRWNTDVLYKY
jgi:hypothetical protein